MWLFKFFAAFVFSVTAAAAASYDCVDLLQAKPRYKTVLTSPTSDFIFRDQLPRSDVPKDQWQTWPIPWGPCPATYPQVTFPDEKLRVTWSRIRVVEAAKLFIGARYAHFHIPEMGGLDCSNFTALVYNYAFGIRFSSNIERQMREAGRLLSPDEPLEPGDLLYDWNRDRTRIAHVVMYVDRDHVIDSRGIGVQLRPFDGVYKSQFAWARRVIE